VLFFLFYLVCAFDFPVTTTKSRVVEDINLRFFVVVFSLFASAMGKRGKKVLYSLLSLLPRPPDTLLRGLRSWEE
jgi:hypothetical protein